MGCPESLAIYISKCWQRSPISNFIGKAGAYHWTWYMALLVVTKPHSYSWHHRFHRNNITTFSKGEKLKGILKDNKRQTVQVEFASYQLKQRFKGVLVSLGKLWEIVRDRESWCAETQGVAKSQTWLSDWTTATAKFLWRKTQAQSAAFLNYKEMGNKYNC